MPKKLTKLEICQRVVNEMQQRTVQAARGRIRLDYLTAQGILLVHEKTAPEHREQFLAMDWEQIANFVWSKVKLKSS